MFQKSSFGSPEFTGFTVPFGSSGVKYAPVVEFDVIVSSGCSKTIEVRIHCISCMKEFKSKSLEELRLEDYKARRMQAPAYMLFGKPTSTFGEPSTSAAPSVFGGGGSLGASGGFGQPNSGISFGGGTQTSTKTSSPFGGPTSTADSGFSFGGTPFGATSAAVSGDFFSTAASKVPSCFSSGKLPDFNPDFQKEAKIDPTFKFGLELPKLDGGGLSGLSLGPRFAEISSSSEYRSTRRGWALSRAPLVRKR